MKKYLITFLVATGFFLISGLPASVFNSSVRQLNLGIDSLEGSIWQGHTESAKLGGIDWDFSLLSLLQAKLSWNVHIKQATQQVLVFDFGIDIFKQLQLSGGTGTLSGATLKTLALLPASITNVALFDVQIEQLNLSWEIAENQAKLDNGKGLVLVKNLNILGERLGDYQLRINSENQQLNAAISEKDGRIKTDLNATLSASNLLNVEGNIETTDQNIQSLLNGIGIKNKIAFNYQL